MPLLTNLIQSTTLIQIEQTQSWHPFLQVDADTQVVRAPSPGLSSTILHSTAALTRKHNDADQERVTDLTDCHNPCLAMRDKEKAKDTLALLQLRIIHDEWKRRKARGFSALPMMVVDRENSQYRK